MKTTILFSVLLFLVCLSFEKAHAETGREKASRYLAAGKTDHAKKRNPASTKKKKNPKKKSKQATV